MVESARREEHALLTLSVGPEIVSASRRFVRECMSGWRLPPELSSDAALLASELVTNALRHGPPPVYLDLFLSRDRVRISVADSSAAPPRRLVVESESENGRGIALLQTVAAAWGTDVRPPGKRVWCELRRRD